MTSWRGPSPRHCTRATQLLSKKCRSGGESLQHSVRFGQPENLNLEPQTSRSRDERVTARPTGRSIHKLIVQYYLPNEVSGFSENYLISIIVQNFYLIGFGILFTGEFLFDLLFHTVHRAQMLL